MASLPKIDSPTRQPIPFAPTVLRPPRFRMALAFGLATLQHGYHSDSTATIPAAASSPSLALAHNSESADGVTYRGLTAFASLSLAVSGCNSLTPYYLLCPYPTRPSAPASLSLCHLHHPR